MRIQRLLKILRAEQLWHEGMAKIDISRASEHLEVAAAIRIVRILVENRRQK